MKLLSPLPRRRGRLEIIPLIDIMFFLLAAFMLVSINKIKIDSLKINLPTNVPSSQPETKEDFVSVSINPLGQVQLDKELMPNKDVFVERLQALYAKNKDQKILISGDREARHGDVMDVLGHIRQAGFQRVAFSIKHEGGAKTGATSMEAVPAPGANPAAPGTAPAPTSAAPATTAAPTAPGTPSTPPAPSAPSTATAPASPSAPAPAPAAPASPSGAAAPPAPTAPAPATH